MTKKDELIIGILNKELKSVKKLLKEEQAQLDDISKNGFDKEIHPGNHESILTGLSYTIGYCTCKIEETKKTIYLLKQVDAESIEAIIEKDREIEKLNKKEFDRVFGEIRKRIKNTEEETELKDVFGIHKDKKNSLDKVRDKQWNRKKK